MTTNPTSDAEKDRMSSAEQLLCAIELLRDFRSTIGPSRPDDKDDAYTWDRIGNSIFELDRLRARAGSAVGGDQPAKACVLMSPGQLMEALDTFTNTDSEDDWPEEITIVDTDDGLIAYDSEYLEEGGVTLDRDYRRTQPTPSPESAQADAPVKMCSMQQGPSIPWPIAEAIYEAYSVLYGTEQSLERLHERGGFGWSEVAHMFGQLKRRSASKEKELLTRNFTFFSDPPDRTHTAATDATVPAETDECHCPQHGNWIAADDVHRLTRELDVLLNGKEGAAKQALLCDIVAQVRSRAKSAADVVPGESGAKVSDAMVRAAMDSFGFAAGSRMAPREMRAALEAALSAQPSPASQQAGKGAGS